MVGINPIFLFPPSINLGEWRAQRDRAIQEKGIFAQSQDVVRKDGEVRQVELTVIPIKDSKGDYFPHITVVRDVTEQKETENRLVQSQKMEAVGQLTGGVAHDFNNLLTVILGNRELLSDSVSSDPNSKRYSSVAIKAAMRGAELFQRLLAFSRKQALQPKPTDIKKILTAATELMCRTLGEDIDIEMVHAGGLWEAMVDESQLENALLNLAINARDAMPGGGTLTFETANTHLDREYADKAGEVTPGQYVLIAVTDNGTGMSAEVKDRVFEPFFTTKEVGEGSGLGLSMVYGFIKQSGGHVSIYSEPGEGTTVKLYLPRVTDGNEEAANPIENDVLPAGGETILVVEDDPDVRDYIATVLDVLGYKVLEAEDGPSALALAEQAAEVVLLLTDVVLPGGMNGREIAEAFRTQNPNIKVLYMSGYTENAIVHQGRLDSGVQLLNKPFKREVLAKRVRAALDGH